MEKAIGVAQSVPLSWPEAVAFVGTLFAVVLLVYVWRSTRKNNNNRY